jgi:hypothetical protein
MDRPGRSTHSERYDLSPFSSRSLRLGWKTIQLHDPVATVLFCAPRQARTTVINGKVVVRDGEIITMEMGAVVETPIDVLLGLRTKAKGWGGP